jgi:hypothetical protein
MGRYFIPEKFMNTQRNQMDPRFAAGAFVLALGAGLFLMFIAWVATSIGASFSSVLRTFGLWVVIALPVGFLAYMMRSLYWTLGAAFAVLAWPATWGVLDSIAAGGREGENSPIDFSQYSSTIINSGWLEWGIEFALVALVAYVFYRERRDW